MKLKWKILCALLLMIPCMWILGGCSCVTNNSNNSGTNVDFTYTVMFYTGIAETFNVSRQDVKSGELVRKPVMQSYYYDEKTNLQYRLNGWYSDPSCETEYLWKFETDRVYANLTLYAKWELRT